jgi:mono/diheme cytochrome c family protein
MSSYGRPAKPLRELTLSSVHLQLVWVLILGGSQSGDLLTTVQRRVSSARLDGPDVAQSAPSNRAESAARLNMNSVTNTGAALFRQKCVNCHGADGQGAKGRELFPSIPDFTHEGWQTRRSDARLRTSISNGKGQHMPPFGRQLSAPEMEAIIRYLRGFGRTQRADDAPAGEVLEQGFVELPLPERQCHPVYAGEQEWSGSGRGVPFAPE